MASWLSTLRFFQVVKPVPRLTRLAFAIVTTLGAVVVALADEGCGRVLLPVLVLQMFAASTGFLTYARRGHFDVLLTGGAGRVQIAAVYWLVSVLPGLWCWMALAAVDLAVHQVTPLLSSGTVAAVVVVSVLPWATTVALTRFAGAIGWLLTLVLTAALTPIGTGSQSIWRMGVGEPAWLAGLTFLLFPARMVGQDAAVHWPAVVPGLSVTVAAMIGAMWWVWHTDVPLETGQ